MPAVPRRFDLNSYPSLKPYVWGHFLGWFSALSANNDSEFSSPLVLSKIHDKPLKPPLEYGWILENSHLVP